MLNESGKLAVDFTAVHFLQPKPDEMTDEEIVEYLEQNFGAKYVPYWKLKNPPNWDEFKAGFDTLGGEPSYDMAARKREGEKKAYWENRARQLAATPNLKKNDVLTALEGVTMNPELTALLKEHLKRAK